MVSAKEEVNEGLTERLVWQAAERDDQAVAREINRGEVALDGIYGLEETGLLDEFYGFVEQIGALELLKRIEPMGIKRVMVPFIQYVLLYVLKILFGVGSMHALPVLLFSNTAAMQWVGFNAHQIKNGICNRGRRQGKSKDVTGPICDDTLTRNIIKIPLKVIVSFFNGVVGCLAQFRILPSNIWISMDGSDLVTTRHYQGCGSVTRKKRLKNKMGRVEEVEVTVYGFKLLAAFYGPLRIPLAAKVVGIQESEGKYFLELLKQVRENLEPRGVTIEGVVVDRGYLDGAQLWEISQSQILFVIPAKSGMHVRVDAKSLAASDFKPLRYEASRKEKLTRGIGKKARPVELETKVVGIAGLTTYAQYGEPGWQRQENMKEGKFHPINAVVVLKWKGRDYGPHGGPVYLTNMSVKKPFEPFDRYDERSLIENGLFKEGKRPWNLKCFPTRSEHGVKLHVFFTLSIMALTHAFRAWKKKQESEEKQQQQGWTWGMEQFRRKVRQQSKDKAIVFIGESYGIFWLSEIMVLMGRKVKDLPKEIDKPDDILRKYNLLTQPTEALSQLAC